MSLIIFIWGGSGEAQPWNNIKFVNCKKEDIKIEKFSNK